MATTASQINSAEVREVVGQFEHWRFNKNKRERIPPKLWGMAVRLCKTYSLNRVAGRLGLNYTALKVEADRRSPDVQRPGLHRRHHKPAFVELTPGNLAAGIIPGSSSAEYVVEAPQAGKGIPRILIRGASASEVAALISALHAEGRIGQA